tara:strand:- start:7384 stop:8025 length:642 start_codon:yes stop_codon:yes gene_type:complete
MPRKFEHKVGSVMTETLETRIQYSVDDDGQKGMEDGLRSQLAQAAEIQNVPWAGNAPFIDQMKQKLDEINAALPDDPQEYFSARKEIFKERETTAWYLHQIILYSEMAERYASEGKPWPAANAALFVGDLWAEMRMKNLWEEHVQRSVDVMSGSANGAAKKRASYEPRDNQIRKDYSEKMENQNSSYRPVAVSRLAKDYDLSPRSIRRIISRK